MQNLEILTEYAKKVATCTYFDKQDYQTLIHIIDRLLIDTDKITFSNQNAGSEISRINKQLRSLNSNSTSNTQTAKREFIAGQKEIKELIESLI